MRVGELRDRITKFESGLRVHQQSWLQSLDAHLPDFPIRNHEFLQQQMRMLARQLGGLRRYIDQFSESTTMFLPALRQEWDVFESATGNDVAQRKRHSLEGALQQLQIILGKLDTLDDSDNVPGDHSEAPGKHSGSDHPDAKPSTSTLSKKIFIGHGRSELWRDLKDFISERLRLDWDEFNREAAAGLSTKERLQTMLNNAKFAFLVMTAEDEHRGGTTHARENVIHELGLFQGRLGFERAIILLEDGCVEFSNINGLTQIRFPKGNIKAAFEEIRRVLERERIIV
jgi:predicted nucleotide-binding protein